MRLTSTTSKGRAFFGATDPKQLQQRLSSPGELCSPHQGPQVSKRYRLKTLNKPAKLEVLHWYFSSELSIQAFISLLYVCRHACMSVCTVE